MEVLSCASCCLSNASSVAISSCWCCGFGGGEEGDVLGGRGALGILPISLVVFHWVRRL
jgi:hypothetical protein